MQFYIFYALFHIKFWVNISFKYCFITDICFIAAELRTLLHSLHKMTCNDSSMCDGRYLQANNNYKYQIWDKGFCNFDFHVSGKCEYCENFPLPFGCTVGGFIDERGEEECEMICKGTCILHLYVHTIMNLNAE